MNFSDGFANGMVTEVLDARSSAETRTSEVALSVSFVPGDDGQKEGGTNGDGIINCPCFRSGINQGWSRITAAPAGVTRARLAGETTASSVMMFDHREAILWATVR